MRARVIRKAGTDRLKTEAEVTTTNTNAALKRARNLISLPEKLAGDKLSYRNHPIPNNVKHFPYDFRLRYVDLYFPYATSGPLYVDFAIFPNDVKRCEEKQKALHLEGCRYIFITPGMSEIQAQEKLDIKLAKGAQHELDHSPL